MQLFVQFKSRKWNRIIQTDPKNSFGGQSCSNSNNLKMIFERLFERENSCENLR